jgi:AraC-like DNA-binding protein
MIGVEPVLPLGALAIEVHQPIRRLLPEPALKERSDGPPDRGRQTLDPTRHLRHAPTGLDTFAHLDQQQIISRVRAMVVERVAHALGLGIRTFQRRLADRRTSYQEVLRATREELACAYLAEGWSVTEIAFMLGFSDMSSFSRAFRRWTGESPSKYGTRQP